MLQNPYENKNIRFLDVPNLSCGMCNGVYRYMEGSVLMLLDGWVTTALTHWQKQRKEWVGSQKSQPRKLREPVIRYDIAEAGSAADSKYNVMCCF